jgi:hypothetical protein
MAQVSRFGVTHYKVTTAWGPELRVKNLWLTVEGIWSME